MKGNTMAKKKVWKREQVEVELCTRCGEYHPPMRAYDWILYVPGSPTKLECENTITNRPTEHDDPDCATGILCLKCSTMLTQRIRFKATRKPKASV